MWLLIVEDEIEIREGVSEYLSEVGYNVITAEDGLQAIELFNKNKIDLVIYLVFVVLIFYIFWTAF